MEQQPAQARSRMRDVSGEGGVGEGGLQDDAETEHGSKQNGSDKER